jgi:hypothetical protein
LDVRYVELLRHTDNDGDKLTAKGIAAAEAIRIIDPDLVENESLLLGSALRGVFDALPEGGGALVVGHSPTNEAAVLGLAAKVIGPLGKGEGVLVIEDGGRFHVGPIEERSP